MRSYPVLSGRSNDERECLGAQNLYLFNAEKPRFDGGNGQKDLSGQSAKVLLSTGAKITMAASHSRG
ncbi:MAG: hypothetical protein ACR2QH_13175 [Geminicoccaceae bacterium]